MSIWRSCCPTWTQVIVNTKEPKTSIWHKKLFQWNQGQFHWQQHCKSKREISWKDVQVLKDFNPILNPAKLPCTAEGIWNHGTKNLERLVERYTNTSEEESLIDADEARNSFIQFKHFLNSNKDKPHEVCEILAKPGVYKDIFPSFVTLAQVFQTIPLTSVPCKRGFSAKNHIHGALRNKMFPSAVECKMYISHASKTHVDLWGKCLW